MKKVEEEAGEWNLDAMSPNLARLKQTPIMDERVVFIPSHLTKALVATGVALAAGGLSFVAGSYALFEFKRVRVEEIAAMIKPPTG